MRDGVVARLRAWASDLWYRLSSRPQSFDMIAQQRRPAPINKLYVLRIPHAASPEYINHLSNSLDKLKAKYGIDFLVIEPGLSISRFDDI